MLLCRLIAEILKSVRMEKRLSDLVKKAYHGKFQSSVEYAQIGLAWPF